MGSISNMLQNRCSCNVCQSEYNFFKKFPEKNPVEYKDDLKDIPMYGFGACNPNTIPPPNPYKLQEYPADANHNKKSQQKRIIDLEKALVSQMAQTDYINSVYEDVIRDKKITQNLVQQNTENLQNDFENLKETLHYVWKKQTLQYARISELTRLNENLSHENALYKSRERMNEIK